MTRRRPPHTVPLSSAAVHVLLAVHRVHAASSTVTVRAVAAEAARSTSTTHHHLRRLARRGFVAWENGAQGTLHPTEAVVPFG